VIQIREITLWSDARSPPAATTDAAARP